MGASKANPRKRAIGSICGIVRLSSGGWIIGVPTKVWRKSEIGFSSDAGITTAQIISAGYSFDVQDI